MLMSPTYCWCWAVPSPSRFCYQQLTFLWTDGPVYYMSKWNECAVALIVIMTPSMSDQSEWQAVGFQTRSHKLNQLIHELGSLSAGIKRTRITITECIFKKVKLILKALGLQLPILYLFPSWDRETEGAQRTQGQKGVKKIALPGRAPSVLGW